MTISDEYFGQLKRVDSDWYEAWIDRPCNGTASRLKVTFTAECEGTMIATLPVIRATLQTYLESSITRIRKYLRDLRPTAYIGELIRIDIWCDTPARSAGLFFYAVDLAAIKERQHDHNAFVIDCDLDDVSVPPKAIGRCGFELEPDFT